MCGTDLEIVAGEYGWAPPGRDRLVLGHESLGRVLDAPAACDLQPGDLVVGAGPIGLLAALLAVQRGLEVHVLDRVTEGRKPALVADLGASYHTGTVAEAVAHADVIIECTGAGELVLDAIDKAGPDGIVCLTGVSSAGRTLTIDPGALNRELVLDNGVVFGTVNANRRHYQAAASALAAADQRWLERLITRRVPLDRWSDALQRRTDDVKAVIDLPA